MSSISYRRPEFRLHLGYPDIVLTRAGRTLATVGTEAPDLRAALARLADAILRARGRLVAVLPEDEVWRGRLDLAGRNRAERRASARSIVAGRLGTSPDEVTVVLGPPDAGGSFPIAGVRRSTLIETRSLLAAVGLRASAIIGAGAFAGFPMPPRLGGWSWRLPAVPQHRRGVAAALGAGAMAGLALIVLGQPSAPPAAPVVLVPAPAPVLTAAAPKPVPTPPPAEVRPQATPRPLGLRFAERPKPRPAAVLPAPMVTVATRNLPADLPLQAAPARRGPVPQLLKLAERTTDTLSAPLRRPSAPPAPATAEIARTAMPELPAPAAAAELRPMPRPRAAAPAAAAAAPVLKPAPAESAALAPRPRARQEPSQAAVLVASLDPAPFVAASVAAATGASAASVMAAPPPARPAERPVAKAAPAKSAPAVARAKPAAAKPAPVVARATPVVVVRPKPVSVQPMVKQVTPQRQAVVRQTLAAPPRAKVVTTAALVQPKRAAQPAAQPAPVRQKVVAKPAPVRKAAKPAAAQKPVVAQKPVKAQKPVNAKPATQRVGLKRGTVSLVGVFAGADGRRALVRLPNGKIERVQAGDRIQGVQVAAINADSVRLTGRGKDTLLRLPN